MGIPDDLFVFFFIVLIFALSNDKKMREAIKNKNIQFLIGFLGIYCLLRGLELKYIFLLFFMVALAFSDIIVSSLTSVKRIQDSLTEEEKDLMEHLKNL